MTARPKVRLNRRRFVAGLSAGAALSPFVPLVGANAQELAPRRIIFVWTPVGLPRQGMTPHPGAASHWACETRSFSSIDELSPILRPLGGYLDQLLFINGLDNPVVNGGDHDSSVTGPVFTATPVSRNRSEGPSIDQFIGARFAGETLFPVLNFGQTRGPDTSDIVYSAAGDPLPFEDDVDAAFQRIFDPTSAMSTARDEARERRRRSILDRVLGDLGSLRTRLGPEDRRRLDAHVEAVRAIEGRLGTDRSCRPPAFRNNTFPGSDTQVGTPMQSFAELLVSAIACDLTRVGFLQLHGNRATYPWLGIPGEWDHHYMTHFAAGADRGTQIEKLTEVGAWYAEHHIAYLASLLEERGLLEHTAIVWTTEHSFTETDFHDRWSVPWVVLGSCGGHFRTGRVVDLRQGSTRSGDPNTGQESRRGRPNGDFFITLCHAMGLTDVRSFGLNSSPIDELVA